METIKRNKDIPSVQFCFVLDATGSMDCYIKVVQQCLLGIFKTFEDLNLAKNSQISFVFYRDFSEENQEYIQQMKECKPAGWKPQKKIEFTDFQVLSESAAQKGGEIYELLEDISKRCDGGDDFCEGIAGGLRQMLNLSWLLTSESTTKIAVLITDAPCHGKEFHDDKTLDDFEDLSKKPEANIMPLIDQMIQNNINFNIIEISTKTNQMVKVISDHYEKKEMSSKLQCLPLVEDLKSLTGIQEIPMKKIQTLAQILLDKLQLSIRRFQKQKI